MYVHILVTNTAATSSARNGNRAGVILAHDVLLQARTRPILLELLDFATNRQNEREATLSTTKCRYLQNGRGEVLVDLNGQAIPKVEKEMYVGITPEAG